MKMKLVGKQAVDYVSRKTNQQVTGLTLHCVSENPRVEGLAVDTQFISSKSDIYAAVCAIPINKEIEVYYNRYGGVDFVEVVK